MPTPWKPVPHPANAPGDFYVEDGCCTRCEVPFTVAPDLFGIEDTNNQCIVKRQPTTPDELERMFQAFDVAELNCIRYKGRERVILMRLEQSVCDFGREDIPARPGPVRDIPGSRWQRFLRWLGA